MRDKIFLKWFNEKKVVFVGILSIFFDFYC